MSLGNSLTQSRPKPSGFDALRILDHEFIVTIDGKEYTFKTPKDEFGRIISVDCDDKSRAVTYEEM